MKIVFAPGFAESLKKCFRSRWHPAELWYKFRCWAWKRYTTVKPRWLGHTWCDRTELLAYTMFEILGQFLEQECSPGHIEWYGEYGHKVTVNGVEKYVRDEMQDLWDWWCKDYIVGIPAREDAIHAEIEKYDGESNGPWYCREYANLETAARVKELYRELTTLETSMHEELQARLHRLVDVRGCMWT